MSDCSEDYRKDGMQSGLVCWDLQIQLANECCIRMYHALIPLCKPQAKNCISYFISRESAACRHQALGGTHFLCM